MSSEIHGAPVLNLLQEWSHEDIRRVGYRVVDLIADHLTSQRRRAVFRPVPAELAAAMLGESAPGSGVSAEELLGEFSRRIEPFPFGNGHPRFFGWVNSPPTAIGVFAEALAAAMNPSCAGGNHGAVYVERQVLNWFKALVGFAAESMGLLVSGGSMATLTALAVARHRSASNVRTVGLQGQPQPLVVYQSAEGHSSIQKAVELLGIGAENLRTLPQDGARRMDATALEQAIQRDLDAANLPMAVVASAGTVNTGAIDPLDRIADVCARHRIWLHVDGAYGAPAVMSGKYRGQLAALARADSITLDPHKWLYVPVEAGLVLVRDAASMRAAFSLVPAYLRTDDNLAGVGGPPWFSEYGFQQTRGFRALKVWMTLKYHGLDGCREAIERNIACAEYLAARIRQSPQLELAEPQSLSIVCFRYAPTAQSAGEAALDALNRRLLEAVQLGGDAFLSGTTMDGRFWLRACIVNYLTRQEDIDLLFGVVCREGQRLLACA